MLPPRGLNANKQSKVYVVFGVSRMAGNTEHVTFFFKNGTSDSNTMLFGIAIRSTIFGMTFSLLKIQLNYRLPFLKWCQKYKCVRCYPVLRYALGSVVNACR